MTKVNNEENNKFNPMISNENQMSNPVPVEINNTPMVQETNTVLPPTNNFPVGEPKTKRKLGMFIAIGLVVIIIIVIMLLFFKQKPKDNTNNNNSNNAINDTNDTTELKK